MPWRMLIAIYAIAAMSPAVGQVRAANAAGAQEDEQPVVQLQRQQTPIDAAPQGSTARSSVGQVGQRQTRDTAAAETGIKPMARIASRIQNRIQSRLRNRIDRNYDPRANATNPFAVAEDQARTAGRDNR